MTQAALRASLSRLAAGDIDIREARTVIRNAIKAGGRLLDDTYTAIRDTTFRIISSRSQERDIALWYDLATHAAALARDADRSDLAERIQAHSELIAQVTRFGERQPLDEVLGRRHVSEILEALTESATDLARSTLAQRTHLADANLSRVLGILDTHGLVRRRREGKEARIGLTDAGRLAAAKLGYASAGGGATSDIQWWQGLSWPIAVWGADKEPVGVNDAFRGFAEIAGWSAPSMLTYDAWCAAIAAISQETRATDQSGVRDIRVSDDAWFRLTSERLVGGEYLAMLTDMSSTMAVQLDLENQVKLLKEQFAMTRAALASMRAELAAVQAELEDDRRRLMSFTGWIDRLKFAVTGETTSLASRLHRWRGRLRSDALRAEAAAADRDLVALRNALQTLLYTHQWSGAIQPLQSIDANSLIGGPIEAVRALGSHNIEIDAAGFQPLTELKTSVTAVQAAIGQSLYTFIHDREASFHHKAMGQYLVRAEHKDRLLRVLLIGNGGTVAPRGYRNKELDWFAEHAGSDWIVECGLGHAHDVAETMGGSIQVAKDQSYILMNLPADASTKRRRARPISLED